MDKLQSKSPEVLADIPLPGGGVTISPLEDFSRRNTGDWASSDFEEIIRRASKIRPIEQSVAESSAHQVYFGNITLKGEVTTVAVKPTPKPHEELINMAEMRKKFGYRIFEPVGIVTMQTYDGGEQLLLTLADDGIDTLENSSWNGVLNDPENHESQIEDLQDMARELAYLHENEVIHGDPQLKNFALSSDGSKFFIDWEAATIDPAKPLSSDQFTKKAFRDLGTMFRSMALPRSKGGTEALSQYTDDTKWIIFKDFVLAPYIDESFELSFDQDITLDRISDIETALKYEVTNGVWLNRTD